MSFSQAVYRPYLHPPAAPIPIQLAMRPPPPPPTFGVAGAGVTGTTSCAVGYPAGINQGTSDIFCFVGSGTATDAIPTMPAGWTMVDTASGADTNTTFGVDGGARRATLFRKDEVTGSESGTVTVSLAGTAANTLGAIMFRTERLATARLQVASTGAADADGAPTTFSAAMSALDWKAGDLVFVGTAINSDTPTASARALTATGITFGSITSVSNTAITAGNDHRRLIDTMSVTSGSGSAAPTWSFTLSANASGAAVLMRLRTEWIPGLMQGAASPSIAATAQAAGQNIQFPGVANATVSIGAQAAGIQTVPASIGVANAQVAIGATARGISLARGTAEVESESTLMPEPVGNKSGYASSLVAVTCAAAGTRITAGQTFGPSETGIEHAVDRLIDGTPDYRFNSDKRERNFYQRHR